MFSFGRMALVKMLSFITAVCLLSPFANAEDAAKSTYTLCKNGAVVRTIRVQLKGQNCRAIYTKEGSDQIVGKSGTPQVCYDVIHKIKTNLEAGNWKCKDISQTRVSSSLE